MSSSEQPELSEHPSIAHFRDTHVALGGTGRIVVLPDSVHTAALAAEALGCEVGAIANSLVFTATNSETGDGEPVLILTSGAHRVDTEKAAALIGVSALRRARPEFVKEHTGQVIGGVSPIAHPTPVRTFLDPTLAQYDVIWAAAGHPAAVFSTTYAELRTMTGADEIEVN
jgi:prolyl-tRNA editing enzyme YbaK/EbsC (Cys-tRNA(Pro) deacylase)